jgi:hypothetical protein
MSAYMVSENHIHALVNYALRENLDYRAADRRVRITPESAEEIGQILSDENYRSVHHRYADRAADYFGAPPTYKFRLVRNLPDAVTMLKLCDCYAYQACETDDWESSIACKLVAAIKDRAARKVPGYDAAPWGID